MFITANVGSLFDATDSIMPGWIEEFLKTIRTHRPNFIAVHFQEFGGKGGSRPTSWSGAQSAPGGGQVASFIEHLFGILCSNETGFGSFSGRAYIDEEFACDEKFTALGSLYLVDQTYCADAFVYNFTAKKYESSHPFMILNNDLDNVGSIQRRKFPQNFFPNFKWTRKGFTRTRWKLKQRIIDVVNVHLFHDACNLTASEQTPSSYAQCRNVALSYTLDWVRQHDSRIVNPMFVFGDFNFRLDTKSVIELLTDGADCRVDSDGTSREYIRSVGSNEERVLKVAKKCFDYEAHDQLAQRYPQLLSHDKEREGFSDLYECKIEFPPSYPYSEDVATPSSFMRTRCPAWCDRILMNSPAWSLAQANAKSLTYGMVGIDRCMGDHKPIYLCLDMLDAALSSSQSVASNSGGGVPLASHPPISSVPHYGGQSTTSAVSSDPGSTNMSSSIPDGNHGESHRRSGGDRDNCGDKPPSTVLIGSIVTSAGGPGSCWSFSSRSSEVIFPLKPMGKSVRENPSKVPKRSESMDRSVFDSLRSAYGDPTGGCLLSAGHLSTSPDLLPSINLPAKTTVTSKPAASASLAVKTCNERTAGKSLASIKNRFAGSTMSFSVTPSSNGQETKPQYKSALCFKGISPNDPFRGASDVTEATLHMAMATACHKIAANAGGTTMRSVGYLLNESAIKRTWNAARDSSFPGIIGGFLTASADCLRGGASMNRASTTKKNRPDDVWCERFLSMPAAPVNSESVESRFMAMVGRRVAAVARPVLTSHTVAMEL
jgi:inositol-1,4,5-trisphosphate 5-phosphatase